MSPEVKIFTRTIYRLNKLQNKTNKKKKKKKKKKKENI